MEDKTAKLGECLTEQQNHKLLRYFYYRTEIICNCAYLFIYLSMYLFVFWPHWVFVVVPRLLTVAEHWLLLLQSTGSRCLGFSSCGGRLQ